MMLFGTVFMAHTKPVLMCLHRLLLLLYDLHLSELAGT